MLQLWPGLQVLDMKSTCCKFAPAKAQRQKHQKPRLKQRHTTLLNDTEEPTPVSVDELMARRPGKADNPFVEPEVAEDASAVNEHEPKLDLPQLQTGNGKN